MNRSSLSAATGLNDRTVNEVYGEIPLKNISHIYDDGLFRGLHCSHFEV
jgi:hypothetical protein